MEKESYTFPYITTPDPSSFSAGWDAAMATALSWISLKAVRYVRMNKEMIWMSADFTEDFRKHMEDKLCEVRK